MTDIFIKLLNMSIVAGWLVVMVMLLRLVLKKAPAWIFCVLWALVALRLLLPVSVQSKTSAVPSVETVPPEIVYTDVPKIHTGFETFNHFVNPYLSDVLAPPFPEEILIEGTLTGSINIPEKTPAQEIVDIATVVWLCGIAAMAVYGIISYVLLKRKVREAVRQEKRIFICDNVTSPFIMGVLFPRIYLPSSITETDAEMVIAHEQAHIKRKDHLWKPFGFLLLTVYWFNPLLWAAYVMFCKDIESACDEKVIKKYGLQIKKQYSEALLNCSTSGKWITACPVAFGETAVKSRIKGVLNYKKPAFWIIILAVLACIATSVFFLTDPLSNETSDDVSMPPWCISPGDEKLIAAQFTFEKYVCRSDSDISLPQFAVTTDNRLLTSEHPADEAYNSSWHELGSLVSIKLAKSNFDFAISDMQWVDNYSAESIRNNTQVSYACKCEDGRLFYLIYLNDGTTLFAFGNEKAEKYKKVVSITAIAKYSTVTDIINYKNILPKLEYEAYTYIIDNWNPPPNKTATVYLEKNGNHFTYCWGEYSLQQYCPYGTYRKDGSKLYLKTADGKNEYVFEITENGIKYLIEDSSLLAYKQDYINDFDLNPVTICFGQDCVFIKENETVNSAYATVHQLVYQCVLKDVDGDGQPELCAITDGPTSGIYSSLICIYDGGELLGTEIISFQAMRFVVAPDGSIQLVFGSEDNIRYDFRLTDEGIICTNTETGEEKPFSEMGGIKQ